MATEIDALQLNFTGRTSDVERSLGRLIKSLTIVGQSINAINSQGFVASMDNVSSTLVNLEFAVNNVNSDRLKAISSGLQSFAKSIKNFSNGANVSETLNQVASGINSIGNVSNMDFSNISVLANSVSKLGSGSGTQAAANLKPIADGIRTFNGIQIPKLEGITDFANGLRSLGSKNVATAAASLRPLGEALRNFPTTVPNVEGVAELARSLSMFGRKTSQQAIETIPRLATAFRQLITELSNAPSVSNNVIRLADALARFVTNVNRVGAGTKSARRGLILFGDTASSVSKKTFSLASAIGKVYATYFLLFRAFRLIKKSIDISADLKEVQNVVGTTFGDMTNKVEEFAQSSIQNFGMSELSAKRYASRFQAMGVAMGISSRSIKNAQKQLNAINPTLADRGYSNTADSIADISLNITKLTADMASFYNVAQEDVAKDLESIWTGQTRPLNLAA